MMKERVYGRISSGVTWAISVNQILDYLEPHVSYRKPDYETLLDQEQYLFALEEPEPRER